MGETYAKNIEALESEWAPDNGFFWRIREGDFAQESFRRALKKMSAIHIPESTELPRRLVSLVWYVPLFMQWQVERVRERGGDAAAYEEAITAMTNEVERLLGVP